MSKTLGDKNVILIFYVLDNISLLLRNVYISFFGVAMSKKCLYERETMAIFWMEHHDWCRANNRRHLFIDGIFLGNNMGRLHGAVIR